ncbi:hypothetical protein [Rhodococcus sp. WAY2]|uniref:hypothetical protein n=1 Tax=Rhodococcus sp. WAY2 TaxID=2663121 RepID=UPI00135C6741|nr:hypothetical protein [Rhodococcus sp. WAY2]
MTVEAVAAEGSTALDVVVAVPVMVRRNTSTAAIAAGPGGMRFPHGVVPGLVEV